MITILGVIVLGPILVAGAVIGVYVVAGAFLSGIFGSKK